MTGIPLSKQALRVAASGTIMIALLAGCAGQGKMANATAPRAEKAASSAKSQRALAKLEQQVAQSPKDAALRVALGHAYLEAGRFESAAATFNDAVALGDQSGRTALSLALAEIGAGHADEAVSILDNWRDAIAPADLGLALALAGETGRGVAILADALRAGDDTPKVRQNLAYAYALDGRWREARVMAAQDLPADKLDARISEWAMLGKPEDRVKRVAGLLGVTPQADPGQPTYLALAEEVAPSALAAATLPSTPAQLPAELPPVAAVAAEAPAVAPAPAAIAAPAHVVASAPAAAPLAPPAAQSFAAAFAAPTLVSQPVVQPLPMRPLETARVAVKPITSVASVGPRPGTHMVQLGSFASADGARRAQAVLVARHPELRGSRFVVTPAVVRGKSFWRVAVAGYSAGTASRLCSSVKTRGGACFAYAASSPAARSVPAFASADPVQARR